MRDDKILYWIWLSEKFGVASREFGKLVAAHDDPFELYRMDEEEIEHLDGIGRTLKEKLCDKSLETAYSILKTCQKEKADIITYADKRYPARLRAIEDPPVLLYCLGRFPDFNTRLCIGMVGTRKMSEYGMQTSYGIAYELASAGVVVVSGMALGIDSVCACGALEAGGETVAVLGCGISVVYPRQHKKLMQIIAKRGAVISEYPPDEIAHGYNFPKRNRIISGLCQGTLIIECSVKSGAMITASRAIDQGRELFALPGKVNESNSDGPNLLIRQGANVALGSDDILDHYNFLYRDVIDRRAHARAKNDSLVSERALSRYGVSWKKYGERYEGGTNIETEEASYVQTKNETSEQKNFASQKNVKAVTDTAKEQAMQNDGDDIKRKEILASLDNVSQKVYEYMPSDKSSVTADVIAARGLDVGDVITALTMLELAGLVSSLPGGAYVRN
ncbi:MAG: DNA-protecting protein DprA [Ruminococcaceae bacterium]|nr:DNA-protecting protein DprA [Oscillospiraceae bacterium]